MRKKLLVAALALCGLTASAQFSVMTTVTQPEDGDSWGADSFTNAMTVGYQLNDKMMIGVQKDGDDYNLVGRYGLGSNLYLSLESPSDVSLESITFGVGYSKKIMGNLYVEPNYIFKEEEGEMRLGIAYKL